MKTETITPKDAQKARITYLLRIAGANAGFADSKWTPAVISQLATGFQQAMEEEGYFFESWQNVADKYERIVRRALVKYGAEDLVPMVLGDET